MCDGTESSGLASFVSGITIVELDLWRAFLLQDKAVSSRRDMEKAGVIIQPPVEVKTLSIAESVSSNTSNPRTKHTQSEVGKTRPA